MVRLDHTHTHMKVFSYFDAELWKVHTNTFYVGLSEIKYEKLGGIGFLSMETYTQYVNLLSALSCLCFAYTEWNFITFKRC